MSSQLSDLFVAGKKDGTFVNAEAAAAYAANNNLADFEIRPYVPEIIPVDECIYCRRPDCVAITKGESVCGFDPDYK